jgi:hypothetical protein
MLNTKAADCVSAALIPISHQIGPQLGHGVGDVLSKIL